MKKVFTLLFISVLSSFGWAGGALQAAPLRGQALIDSMLKELQKQKDDTGKAKILNSISSMYQNISNEEGIKYGRQDSALCVKLGWKKGIAASFSVLGVHYWRKADYTKALQYYATALTIDEEIAYKKGVGTITGNIGIVYWQQGYYARALEYFYKAIKIQDEIGDKEGVARNTGDIGIIYEEQGDYAKALEYDLKALKMEEERGDIGGVAINSGNIATLYFQQGNYSMSLEYNFKALKVAEENGDKRGAAIYTGNIGDTYAKEGNYPAAITYTKRAFYMAEEIGDRNEAAWALEQTGNACLELAADTAKHPRSYNNFNVTAPGNAMHVNGVPVGGQEKIPAGRQARLDLAVAYLLRARDSAKQLDAPEIMRNCYEQLEKAYKLSGNYKKALESADAAMVVKDSLFSLASAKKIAGMENRQKEFEDSMKTDFQISLLKSDNEKKQAEIKQSKIIFGAVSAVLLLVVLFLVLYLLQRQKITSQLRKNISLEATLKNNLEEQLVNVQAQALQAQMNPHFIFNSLASIQSLILQEDKTNAVRYLRDFAQLSRLTLEHSRKDTVKLKEEIQFLNNYLELEAMRHNHSFNHSVTVNEQIDTDFETIPPMLIQPFAENAIKHGLQPLTERGFLSISFSLADIGGTEALTCIIDDNGIGRAAAEKNKSRDHISIGTELAQARAALQEQKREIKKKYSIEIHDKTNDDGNAAGTRVTIVFVNYEEILT